MPDDLNNARAQLREDALRYHEEGRPGKLEVVPTKPVETQRDLSLAYSPGVAAPCQKIFQDPAAAYDYTAKGNLVAIVSNGTAVLGLGNLGALAAKPVMEGKAVLFKKYADIDVFDIEVAESDPDKFIEVVAALEPTFGGINLEDIKAPESFYIEQALKERMKIPVFHDDQHGTAIIVVAGLLNALDLQGKNIKDAKIVCLGAGAAGIASLKLCLALGASLENISVLDRKGVIHSGRDDLPAYKAQFAHDTDKRTLDDAMDGADVFIGVSGPGLVEKRHIEMMAAKPVVFALSNPDPEIYPEDAQSVRDDLIMATGRSDYPNQVNNVLGFPYIFRGALDVRARRINQEMHLAAVHALRELAREPVPQSVLEAYDAQDMSFGPDYIIPKPFDPRLIDRIPPAVAQAAIDSGVSRTGYPKHYPKLDDAVTKVAS